MDSTDQIAISIHILSIFELWSYWALFPSSRSKFDLQWIRHRWWMEVQEPFPVLSTSLRSGGSLCPPADNPEPCWGWGPRNSSRTVWASSVTAPAPIKRPTEIIRWAWSWELTKVAQGSIVTWMMNLQAMEMVARYVYPFIHHRD